MGKLLIVDRTGHVEIEFAPPEIKTKEALETRQKARRIFDEVMTRPGWAFIANAPKEREGERLTRFDPSVTEATGIGPIVGG